MAHGDDDDDLDDELEEDEEEEDEEEDEDEGGAERSRGGSGSVVGRLVEGVLSVPALTLGQKIGTDSASVVAILDKVEAVIGPMMTGMLITTAGGMTRMPKALRKALIEKGFPRPVVNVLNRLFEDVFEGIWAARRIRRANKDEPITREDVRAGFKKTKENLEKKSSEEKGSLMSALGKVDAAKRRSFLTKVGKLTGDDKKKYEQYRTFISKEAWLIEELADKPVGEWFTILEAVLGAPPKEKGESKLAGIVGKLTGRATDALSSGINEIVDNPDAAMTEMARGVDQVTTKLDGWAARIRAGTARSRAKFEGK